MKETSKVGKFLREYRKTKNNMTLRDFSEATGISFSHLSKIERGEHNPSKTTLRVIADALDIDKDELYIMAGYTPKKDWGKGLEAFFPSLDEVESEKISIMKKISDEFPDADLMFNDLANMDAEQLEEVYQFIKFKAQQNK